MLGRRQIVKYFNNLTNVFNKYHKMTSDDFFSANSSMFKKKKIDVAFIDGLHEHKQVIRDINNCLDFLSKKGVIVLHDCNPTTALMATPFDSLTTSEKKCSRWTKFWSGDVWKAIVYFRSQRNDLNIFTLN